MTKADLPLHTFFHFCLEFEEQQIEKDIWLHSSLEIPSNFLCPIWHSSSEKNTRDVGTGCKSGPWQEPVAIALKLSVLIIWWDRLWLPLFWQNWHCQWLNFFKVTPTLVSALSSEKLGQWHIRIFGVFQRWKFWVKIHDKLRVEDRFVRSVAFVFEARELEFCSRTHVRNIFNVFTRKLDRQIPALSDLPTQLWLVPDQ